MGKGERADFVSADSLWDLARALMGPLEVCQSEFMVELVIWRVIAVQIKSQGLNANWGIWKTKGSKAKQYENKKAL